MKPISIAALLAAALSAAGADATIYTFDRTVGSVGNGRAVGSITTDGSVGVLTNDNITGFDITVSLQGYVRSFRMGAGWYNIVGNALSATETGLFFDAALPGSNYFYFSSDTYYYPGVYSIYSQHGGEGVQVYDVAVRSGEGGLIRFADAAGAVPEPATWATMILGLGAVGVAVRRRKSASRAIPATV